MTWSCAFPILAPNTALFDPGANMECKLQHLLSCAIIVTVYPGVFLGIPNPTVALLPAGGQPKS
jgi:fatty acid/phospholipid biosynthesis enzyme